VRGGSGWEQFQRRKAGGWTGSGQVARGEGGEAMGRGDLGGVAWSWEFRRGSVAAARCREEEEEGKAAGESVLVGFIEGLSCRREGKRERQSRAKPRKASGAGVPSGVWQSLGSDSPTWPGEGRTAEAARRWEEGWGDAWKGGAERQGLGKRPAAGGHARAAAEEIGDLRKTMEDLGAKSRKARDPTVMYR
jgi:hypothetical protein